MIDYIWRINNLDVYYTNETNGGGDYLALEYMDVIKDWYEHADNVLEWCSGPGFIGYSLLASNLCKNISFLEKYKPSVEMCQKTKENSSYEQNIKIYLSDSLEIIPKTEKFNLVVGNPPHWSNEASARKELNFNFDINNIPRLVDVLIDYNWNSHRNFFKQIKYLLEPSGKILLQENLTGSSAEEFEEMVNEADLKILSFAKSKMYEDQNIYYLEVGH